MFGDVITVFNRKGALWYPTILEGVNLNIDRSMVVEEYGEQSTDTCVLNVHLPAEKPYLPPKEWQALEDSSTAFTFTSGQKCDFFYAGRWDWLVPVADSDYGMMSFYDYMNKNEDFVYAVTGCSYFSVIPHLEVTGK